MYLNIMIWNARGVANVNTQSIIKHLIKEYRISVLAIIEPFIKPNPDFSVGNSGFNLRVSIVMVRFGCLLRRE